MRRRCSLCYTEKVNALRQLRFQGSQVFRRLRHAIPQRKHHQERTGRSAQAAHGAKAPGEDFHPGDHQPLRSAAGDVLLSLCRHLRPDPMDV